MNNSSTSNSFISDASVFLKWGLTGFGGPIAVMAMMEEEACRRRQWLSLEKFGEVYAILKLFPGPLATQMVLHLGWLRGGVLGGIIAGTLFTFPGFVIMLGFGLFYAEMSGAPTWERVLVGMQAGALAVILISAAQLAKPYRAIPRAWAIGAISALLVLGAPAWEPLIILGAGLLGVALSRPRAHGLGLGMGSGPGGSSGGALAIFSLPVASSGSAAGAGTAAVTASVFSLSMSPELLKLLWVCFKAGVFVFGSGLAIVPLLEADVVTRYQWLTHAQFMDGLAIGQATPGPVVKTATFIGYQVAGTLGAVAATVAIFAPAFFNVLVILPRILERMTNRRAMQAFTSSAIPAVVGSIAAISAKLALLTLATPIEAALFVTALCSSIFLRAPAWLVIPGAGALSGLIRWALG